MTSAGSDALRSAPDISREDAVHRQSAATETTCRQCGPGVTAVVVGGTLIRLPCITGLFSHLFRISFREAPSTGLSLSSGSSNLKMPLLRRLAGVIVSLLLLQTSVGAAGGVNCASASGRMGGVGSTMKHGPMTMPDTPKSSSALAVSVTTSAPLDKSCADSHGAACIAIGSCTSTGNLTAARSMEAPRTPAGAVFLQPAAMAQSPGPSPEVPPPRA